jgi:putative FmdB family regulatory protein
MPIYEYSCRGCGHQFEYLLLRTSPAAECPQCHKQDLEQLISLSAASTDASRDANLSAAHRKAAGVRSGRQRDQHQEMHEHFHDAKGGAKE